MKTYVKLVENNDNEGETWVFFLQKDGNEKKLEELKALVDEYDDNPTYKLDLDEVLEEDVVDTLVKHGNKDLWGYMDPFNKIDGILTKVPKLSAVEGEEEDELYKGGISDFFKAA